MIIYYLGFSLTEHAWKSYSRSVWFSLFPHLLHCSLCLKMLCDGISLLQTQFRTTQTELLPDGSDLSLSALLRHQYIRGSGSSGNWVCPACCPSLGSTEAAKSCRSCKHPKLTQLHRVFFLLSYYLIIPELFRRNKPCSTWTHSVTGGLILNKVVLKPHS